MLVDIDSGAAATPLPHADEAALVGSPAWIGDSSFAIASNIGRDFMAIVRHELGSGATVPLTGAPLDVDTDVVSSRDGSTLLLIENRNGAARDDAARRRDRRDPHRARDVPNRGS